MKNSEKLYLDTLKSLEPYQSSVILAAALAKRLNALNNIGLFDEYVVGMCKIISFKVFDFILSVTTKTCFRLFEITQVMVKLIFKAPNFWLYLS